MNYLAHGFRFTDEPYFLAGTAAPDWLSVIDRKMRLRARRAAEFAADADPQLAALARGVIQHHHDDEWFHQTEAFNALQLAFAVEIRRVLPGDEGFRPSFLGHILVELLLDAVLAEEEPGRLDNYYAALDRVDPATVQAAINRLATCTTDRLEMFIPRFNRERFLSDYGQDNTLLVRLNHVMKRVQLPVLPDDIAELFPAMRRQVRQRRDELLPSERIER
ncbi:MAG: hypothetical protein L0211_27105 [Planctomycetaceae bacterium]|nr:hypothetical protein [Planctomycetaceae bacterium]